jgi:hypothetical protein
MSSLAEQSYLGRYLNGLRGAGQWTAAGVVGRAVPELLLIRRLGACRRLYLTAVRSVVLGTFVGRKLSRAYAHTPSGFVI